MACKVMKTGQQQLLTDLLSAGENWNLRLFSTSHTPAVTDVLSTYTAIEASFTGYSSKTITRTIASGTWGAVALTGSTIDGTNHNAISTYGTTQTWTATSSQIVYGHFYAGAFDKLNPKGNLRVRIIRIRVGRACGPPTRIRETPTRPVLADSNWFCLGLDALA